MKPTSSNVPVPSPLIKIVGLAVVGDKQIELAVVVEVGPDRGQAVAMLWILDSGLLRDIGEGAVPIVVVEIVGRSLQAARPALHIDAHVFAGVPRAEGGHVVEMEIDIVGDERDRPSHRRRSRQMPRPWPTS